MSPNEMVSIPRTNIPFCIFLFFMSTDEGFFAWINEPVIREDGKKELLHRLSDSIVEMKKNKKHHVTTTWVLEPLNDDALDTIVNQVNYWYAADE
jgi:hypothetical protein